jgi:phage tail protein X
VTFRIRRDDTLTRIVQQVYGRDDWRLVEEILAANPFITNPNSIRIGDELLLPPAVKRN